MSYRTLVTNRVVISQPKSSRISRSQTRHRRTCAWASTPSSPLRSNCSVSKAPNILPAVSYTTEFPFSATRPAIQVDRKVLPNPVCPVSSRFFTRLFGEKFSAYCSQMLRIVFICSYGDVPATGFTALLYRRKSKVSKDCPLMSNRLDRASVWSPVQISTKHWHIVVPTQPLSLQARHVHFASR